MWLFFVKNAVEKKNKTFLRPKKEFSQKNVCKIAQIIKIYIIFVA